MKKYVVFPSALCALSHFKQTKKKQKERDVLPTDVVPRHYFVSLTPDLVKHFKFIGRVEIDLDVVKETSEIRLHSLDLHFINVNLTQADKTVSVKTSDIKFEEEVN